MIITEKMHDDKCLDAYENYNQKVLKLTEQFSKDMQYADRVLAIDLVSPIEE